MLPAISPPKTSHVLLFAGIDFVGNILDVYDPVRHCATNERPPVSNFIQSNYSHNNRDVPISDGLEFRPFLSQEKQLVMPFLSLDTGPSFEKRKQRDIGETRCPSSIQEPHDSQINECSHRLYQRHNYESIALGAPNSFRNSVHTTKDSVLNNRCTTASLENLIGQRSPPLVSPTVQTTDGCCVAHNSDSDSNPCQESGPETVMHTTMLSKLESNVLAKVFKVLSKTVGENSGSGDISASLIPSFHHPPRHSISKH